MRKPHLGIQTHIILGRALSGVAILALAALRETRDVRQREALLRFRADLDRFRSTMDDTVFRDNPEINSEAVNLLARIYFGGVNPLEACEMRHLCEETLSHPPCAQIKAARRVYPLCLAATDTAERMSHDLAAVVRLLNACRNSEGTESALSRVAHE